MYITIHDSFLEILEVDSKNEMLNNLKSYSNDFTILGEDSEQEYSFYVVKLYRENAKGYFGLGIISEGHGLKPHIMVHPYENAILIGFNKEIVIFDCNTKAIIKRYELDSLFYSFISQVKQGYILAVHELGIIKLTLNGEKDWEHSSDIINGYTIKDDMIELEFEDNKVLLLLSTGTLLH